MSSLHKAIDITNKEVDLINDALLKQEELKKITEESYKDHILNVISTMVFDK